MKKDTKKDDGKQPYEKPRLRIIELSAEEVLAVGCKLIDGGNAPSAPTCISVPCSEAGS